MDLAWAIAIADKLKTASNYFFLKLYRVIITVFLVCLVVLLFLFRIFGRDCYLITCYFRIFVLPAVLDKLRCCNGGIYVNEPFTVHVHFKPNGLETVMIETDEY